MMAALRKFRTLNLQPSMEGLIRIEHGGMLRERYNRCHDVVSRKCGEESTEVPREKEDK